MMKTLWMKQTGEARQYDAVDAKEILRNSPDLYTDIDPNPPNAEEVATTLAAAPQDVANVENEYRREPVGDNPPEAPRDQPIIRNRTGATWPGVAA